MKTHLLTKKRALISSVAMLLVAIIALGTATFAWFTSSTQAYADGVYVRTTKVSNLVLNSKLDASWRTHVEYNVGGVVGGKTTLKRLSPISTVDGSNWYYAEAKEGTSFAADTATKYDTAMDPLKNVNDYYFADQINIKNAGQADCKDVTITIEGDLGDYGRIAVVPVTDKGLTTIAPLEEGKTKWKDYIIDQDGVEYKAATGTTLRTLNSEDHTYTDQDVEAVTPSTNKTINVGTIGKDKVKYFNVYVWFEGQDEQCNNANSGQFIPNLTLTVDGTAVDDNVAGN